MLFPYIFFFKKNNAAALPVCLHVIRFLWPPRTLRRVCSQGEHAPLAPLSSCYSCIVLIPPLSTTTWIDFDGWWVGARLPVTSRRVCAAGVSCLKEMVSISWIRAVAPPGMEGCTCSLQRFWYDYEYGFYCNDFCSEHGLSFRPVYLWFVGPLVRVLVTNSSWCDTILPPFSFVRRHDLLNNNTLIVHLFCL